MRYARSTPIAWFLATFLFTGAVGAQSLDDKAVLLEHANEPWTGDLDGMVDRGFVRLLTTFNPLFFSYDDIGQRGLAVDAARALEERLNKSRDKKKHPIHVVLIPVARDKLLTGLREGQGDIAAANLTITPARQELVDFSNPTYPGVSELVVTGPGASEITSLDDLQATGVSIRRSSSYSEHLLALNEMRKKEGKPEIPIHFADEYLEDYDLLEMVNAGIIPTIIVDSHKAALWSQVFDDIRVHEDLAVHSGGNIAWAVRKGNPMLLAAVNGFVKDVRKGTLLGNILRKRYFGSTRWIDNVLSGKARERYQETVEVIKHFAGEYDFDWMMIAAQGYQESKLDQSKKSHAGAIGIMQVMPKTAADPNVGIPDIDKAEQNVHAGVKYLRFVRERYFSAAEIEPVDRVLFSFAAYNAGPGNIAKARKRATKMGFDPNRWFGHVEVAAAKTISREPVIYVRNIYKYYVAYRRLEEIKRAREAAEESHTK